MKRYCRNPSDVYRFLALIKDCAHKRDMRKGEDLHHEICRNGLEKDAFIASSLIGMYAKFGFMEKAREILNNLHVQDDVVSWNALIGGYTKHHLGNEALDCFNEMREKSISPNVVTYVSALKACAIVRAPYKGQEIHIEVLKKGLLDKDVSIGSTLIEMYTSCGLLCVAHDVFDKLPNRDIYSWNALIGGYVTHECDEKALECFDEVQSHWDLTPDAVTYVCALKACASIGALYKGQEIHGEVMSRGLFHQNRIVANSLVDMYANCGMLTKAKDVFDCMEGHDVVSWTSLMTGYVKCEYNEEALRCLESMQGHEGISPDSATFVCCLKACLIAERGGYIHAEIVKKGLEREVLIGNALIDMYVHCGLIESAHGVLSKMPSRDVISWTTLIGGYVKQGYSQEALDCITKMQCEEDITTNTYSLMFGLKACGSLGTEAKGREIHSEIAMKGLGFSVGCPFLSSALVDMYVNCGLLIDASYVFDKLSTRDDVSYTAMITGFAQVGDIEGLAHLLRKMEIEGIKPNSVTYQSVLNACSHVGLSDSGQAYFEVMSNGHCGMNPCMEHYVCIIDLFGRAGQVENMSELVGNMPFHPNSVTWHAVLGACRKWGNVEAGHDAFRHAIEMAGSDEGAYFSMFNIYMDAGMHVDAKCIDESRLRKSSIRHV